MIEPAVDQQKRLLRERTWQRLEQRNAVPRGVHGHIPAFAGAAEAAARLAELPAWRAATVIKAVPDRAQLPVRELALTQGKLVYMAVPELADERPFYELDPDRLNGTPKEAADKDVAATVATKVDVTQMRPIDLIVCGSVAVNRQGVRLGKGAGYSDIEVALLHEAGLVGPRTTIVTTVHPLQILDEPLPETEHDFSVDIIVTPDEVIFCPLRRQRPRELLWSRLTDEQLAAIPVLAARKANIRLKDGDLSQSTAARPEAEQG